jgi:dinuclear metal center YbgI/SA1388 family protein
VKLDSRLSAVAGFVNGSRLVDMGTDHAFLPIFLLESGKITSAIAADINDGPLETGRKNAERFGLSEKIVFIKSDGLDKIDLNGVTDISIAGMGGELIADILSRAKKRLYGINLILQPQTKREYLFGFLMTNGFFIKSSRIINDDKKTYEIINTMMERKSASVISVFEAINGIAPFEISEKLGDNSGLLVGDFTDNKIERILVTLDISSAAVKEAVEKNCDLIISHHPVIYKAIKNLSEKNPAVKAAKAGIPCICAHLNIDASKVGMSYIFIKMFENFFETGSVFNKNVLEDLGGGHGLGITFELPREMKISRRDFAEKLKTMFGSGVVRYTDGGTLAIKKIAFCSGAGGEYLTEIIDENLADIYITSDCKHSVFIEANNAGFPLFDCGHYATEAIIKEYLADFLKNIFPDTEILISEIEKEPFLVV